MAVINTEATFTISVEGETTGELYKGAFKVKTRLSHRDQLNRDRVRRDLLGADAANASPRALTQAEVFSQLAVRLTSTPPWWSDNGGGLDLADDNVVAQVYEAAIKAENDAIESIRKAAEQAKAELK